MSKFLLNTSLLFIVLSVFLFINPVKTALALESCPISYTPNPAHQNMNDLTITVSSSTLKEQKLFYKFNAKISWSREINVEGETEFKNSQATVVIKRPTGGWDIADYTFYLSKKEPVISQNAFCKSLINVQGTPQQTSCTVALSGYPYTPDTDVLVNIKGLEVKENYDIFVNNLKQPHSFKFDQDEVKNGQEINLGTFNAADYYEVSILKQCSTLGMSCWGKAAQTQCPLVAFSVGPRGTTSGGPVEVKQELVAKQCSKTDPDCTTGGGKTVPGCTDNKDNPGIATAIGCIRTNPVELTKSFLKFALGISGGLAFLLMIFGAFQMLTSAGNPETLNAGKDRLTSAVIGLLLIIFSVLLLQIIGVDILGLPGFGR